MSHQVNFHLDDPNGSTSSTTSPTTLIPTVPSLTNTNNYGIVENKASISAVAASSTIGIGRVSSIPTSTKAQRNESSAAFDRSLTRTAAALLLEEQAKLKAQQQQSQNASLATSATEPSNNIEEKKDMGMGEHWQRVDDVITALSSDAKVGLSTEEAKRRHAHYGNGLLYIPPALILMM
jgi:hypothetical protein